MRLISPIRTLNIRAAESVKNTVKAQKVPIPFHSKDGLYVGIVVENIYFDPDSPSPLGTPPQGVEASVNCVIATKASNTVNTKGFIAKSVLVKFRINGTDPTDFDLDGSGVDSFEWAKMARMGQQNRILETPQWNFDPPMPIFSRSIYAIVEGFANEDPEGFRAVVYYRLALFEYWEVIEILQNMGFI